MFPLGPVVSVVGDDRSGDPLHERCDESDVYEGEIAQVDVVPELVGWFDGVIDGLCSLVDVARGSVGGVAGNVFEEVEERFAHPSVCSTLFNLTLKPFRPVIVTCSWCDPEENFLQFPIPSPFALHAVSSLGIANKKKLATTHDRKTH